MSDEQKHAYACHCVLCDGMVALMVAGSPDTGDTLKEWADMDNTYIERHTVEAANDLAYCEHAWTDQ